MRIAFVDQKLNLRSGGGSNRTIHYLATALTELGHEISVITLAPRLNDFPDDLPYRVIEDSSAGLDSFPGRLAAASIFRKWQDQVDIFQIEAPSLIVPAGLYRRFGGRVPVVAQLHIYGHFCSSFHRMDADCWRTCSLLKQIRHRNERSGRKVLLAPVRLAEYWTKRLLADRVDRFVAVSTAMGEIHAKNGINPQKIVTISPPADLGALTQRAARTERRATIATAPYRLLYVGRLVAEKGLDVLLRAVAGLDFPCEVEVIGDGPARADFERLTHELGLNSRVHFRGWISHDNIVECYLGSQLFVHPGRWPDPAPRTIIEAMALGVPLVVSATGGAPAMAGDAALSFTPGDHNDLRAKIAALHANPALSAELVAAGGKRVGQFDTRHTLGQFLDIYHTLCPPTQSTIASAAA